MTGDASPTNAEVASWLALDRCDYERGWRSGYRAGYSAGWDVGFARCKIELDESWRRLAERVVRVGTELPIDALRELRDRPTGEAWQRWRERHGEYHGGPVSYYRPGSEA